MFNIFQKFYLIIFFLLCVCVMGVEECGDGDEDCIEVEVGQCIIFVDKDGEEIE